MLAVVATEDPPPASPPEYSRWRRLKRGCLHALQAGLHASGLASLYVRLSKASGATIFNFHSVAEPGHDRWIDPRFHLSPRVFERQMRFLSRRRHPVSLGHLVKAVEEGRDLPPRSVVVTLDDGYLDHFTVAAPILAKYGIPATFFLPTGYVSRGENQWVDRLFSSFRRRTRNLLHLEKPPARRYDLGRPEEARQAFDYLGNVLLTATYPERIAQLRKVDDQLGPEGEAPRLTMDWNDVKRLEKLSPDFDIGGHSRDHIDLSAIGGDDVRREISECAGDLRRELGEAPRHFSYPYERWTPEAKAEVRRQGFHSAAGAGPDFLITRRSDLYVLPRLDPVERRSTFGFVTSGAFPALSKALVGRA